MKNDTDYETLTEALLNLEDDAVFEFELSDLTEDELDVLADRVDLIDNPTPNLWN